METFFKVCPPELYESKNAKRVDSRNHLVLNNGSEVYWLHLDEYDESVVRGLELNSYLVDQAEEIDENIYLHLDARIDRWDKAQVPEHLAHLNYKKNPVTGKPKPPAYGMLLCNPDAFTHFIYRRYHPDSSEHHLIRTRINRYTGEKIIYRWSDSHVMVNATSYDNPALSEETLAAMESRGPSFVKRFVLGEWGRPGGAIHEILSASKLYDPPKEWVEKVLNEGKLYFALDHGDASPTCGLWMVKWKSYIICWQEYYRAGELISKHRENIGILNIKSDGIYFNNVNICDPSMFNKTQQKKGGIYTLADEYATSEYKSPPIHFQPADNNEFLTRSRISEALRTHPEIKHPLTGESGAPILYFLMRTENYPFGCNLVVKETEAQKYEKLGTINGEEVFGDDREKNVPDHAYDPLRYGLARILMHGIKDAKPLESEMSFNKVRERAIRMQKKFKRIAGVDTHSYGRTY